MKLKIGLILTGLLFAACTVNAQQGPPPGDRRPSPEGRLKHVTEKLEKDLSLKPEQKQKVADAYKTFFASMEKIGAGSPPPPPPPPARPKKEDVDKLVKARDESVKKALTDEQYKKYQEIEKNMGPGGRRGLDDRGPQGPPPGGAPPQGQ